MIWWCRQKNKPCSMANENGYCQITACCKISTPTVKAIPIEFLKQYLDVNSQKFNALIAEGVRKVIKDWEKENARD